MKLSFKPKQKTKKLLKDLQDRSRYVIVNRFGLEGDGERRTLESIGGEYGITRERVRQIEDFALKAIRKSDTFLEAREIFEELKDFLYRHGGVVNESEFLATLSDDKLTQNHINLYLVLGDDFIYQKENKEFHPRWHISEETSAKVQEMLNLIFKDLNKHDLITEDELIQSIMGHDHMEDIHDDHSNEDTALRWLNISKRLKRNPLGEWGRHDSPNVQARGIKDYAYLVMRKHGSPMHFREVAQAITDVFGRPTHTATCHNELIKDPRFVLVGRGLYALKDWGYKSGVVRDVIKDIIKRNGPMTKDDIVNEVLKERYLKRNTILVNLQNTNYFTKDSQGLYHLAEE